MGETKTVHSRHARRNYALGVLNGVAFRFAETLVDASIVQTWFVSTLTTSNFLIGLVSPLGMVGWYLPQIFVSGRVQRMERKTPMYVAAAAVRTAAWVLLALTLWLAQDPLILLVGFFGLSTIARMASGVGGLPFFDIIAKIIPTRRRGTFFGLRQFVGGLLGLGGAWIVSQVLGGALAFPKDYAVLFLAYACVTAASATALAFTKEPAGTVDRERVTLRQQFRRAGRILKHDRVFDTYIAARASLGLAAIALPFIGVFAKTSLGAPAAMVGLYVGVRVGASLAFNLLWGRLSDARGNRLVLRLMCLARGLAVLLAIVLVVVVETAKPEGAWLPYLALPVFFLDGASAPAYMLVGNNFLIEFVPAAERPLYLGLSSTFVGTILLLTFAGGLLADLLGFAGLFAVSLVLYLVAYGLATALPEPRESLATSR